MSSPLRDACPFRKEQVVGKWVPKEPAAAVYHTPSAGCVFASAPPLIGPRGSQEVGGKLARLDCRGLSTLAETAAPASRHLIAAISRVGTHQCTCSKVCVPMSAQQGA